MGTSHTRILLMVVEVDVSNLCRASDVLRFVVSCRFVATPFDGPTHLPISKPLLSPSTTPPNLAYPNNEPFSHHVELLQANT
jgi:hypothetical protein